MGFPNAERPAAAIAANGPQEDDHAGKREPLLVSQPTVEAQEDLYAASPVKRVRATNAEMEVRAEFLIDYAAAKRVSPADRKWPHNFACELDAIPPDKMRALVETAIIGHVDHREMSVLKVAEKSERELLKALGRIGGAE